MRGEHRFGSRAGGRQAALRLLRDQGSGHRLDAATGGRLRGTVAGKLASCPGTVETPFVEGYLEKSHKHEKEKVRAELHARQPVGRMGRPEEIAHLVLYLCSAEAEFVTGSAVSHRRRLDRHVRASAGTAAALPKAAAGWFAAPKSAGRKRQTARGLPGHHFPQLVHPAGLIEAFHHPKTECSPDHRIQDALAVRRQAEPNPGIVVAGGTKSLPISPMVFTSLAAMPSENNVRRSCSSRIPYSRCESAEKVISMVFGSPKLRRVLPSGELTVQPAPGVRASTNLIHCPSGDHSGS